MKIKKNCHRPMKDFYIIKWTFGKDIFMNSLKQYQDTFLWLLNTTLWCEWMGGFFI